MSTVAHFLLGSIFVLAGLLKSVQPYVTARSVSEVLPLSDSIAYVFAISLIVTEIVLGSFLVFQIGGKRAVYLAFGLVCCFVAWNVWRLTSPTSANCGCGWALMGFGKSRFAPLIISNLSLLLVLVSMFEKGKEDRGKYDRI